MKAVDRTKFIQDISEMSVRVGLLLRERRQRLGMSQDTFADHVERVTGMSIDRQTINRIELARYSTSVVRLTAIAVALNIKLSDLFRAAESNHAEVVTREPLTAVGLNGMNATEPV